MRRLNEFFRSLSKFLVDPAGHVHEAWGLVKGAIDPKLIAPTGEVTPLRNAVVVIDNMVEAVHAFLKAEMREPTKQTENGDGESA